MDRGFATEGEERPQDLKISSPTEAERKRTNEKRQLGEGKAGAGVWEHCKRQKRLECRKIRGVWGKSDMI